MNKNTFFEKLASFIVKHFKGIIVSALIILVVSIISIAKFTQIKTNFKDMMSEDNPKIEEYQKIIDKFKSASNILVMLEGKKQRMIKFTEHFVDKISKDRQMQKYIKKIEYNINRDFSLNKGLMLSEPNDLRSMKYMFEKLGFLGFFKGINMSFANSYSTVNTHHREHETVRFLDSFQLFLENMIKYLKSPEHGAEHYALKMVNAITIGSQYYFSPDKKLQMFYIHPTINSDQIDKVVNMVVTLRKKIKIYKKDFPDVKILLGGEFPLIADEYLVTQEDFSYPSLIALALILLLFYFSFKNFSSTIIVILTLILGIITAFGLGIFVTRELNIVSSFFLILLIGLGIDYGIHITSHFTDYMRKYNDIEKTISETFKDSGMGIIIGALTTSLAFFTLMIPSAKAFKQLGLYAGAGILMCLLYMMLLLPSLLVWRFKNKKIKQSKVKLTSSALSSVGKKTVKYRYVIIPLMIIITVISVFIGKDVGFNYDMLSLEPQDISAVKVTDKIVKSMNMSPSFAVVSTDDLKHARKITRRFKLLAYVGRVDSISDYIPPKDKQEHKNQKVRLRIIKQIRNAKNRMNYIPASKSVMDKILYQLKDFRDRIIELSYAETLGGLNLVKQKRITIVKEKQLFKRLKKALENIDEQTLNRLKKIEKQFSIKMNQRIMKMTQISVNPDYPVITVENLPKNIKNNYVSEDGKSYIIRIYPHKNIWEEKFLRKFVNATSRIQQGITGMPVLFLEVSDLMKREGIEAVIIAFIAIFILLLINYSVTDKNKTLLKIPYALLKSVLTAIPLIIGTIITVAIMKLIGMKFNINNVMAIPLLLGMGVDDGVHIAQRYITEGYKNMQDVIKHTGKAVILTTLTTMISFGTLGFLANHVGMATFGILIFIGMGVFMIVSILFLPSLLHIFLNKLSKKQKGE